ncbi:MAG: type II toxin-antitoxin system HicB family antitoxin [Firmicutes bacterium]|nr:type II toxin-antitoxin system HicB family antitoxin [Bacillota bacterium]MBQ6260076.1 type II toxin-antitoxin system HicB family antitoxin [Bacillota bacterium]MBR0440498.1 type II toxin-antitoxin system HicB family antitoxin [Bacillota bacterium]
MKTINYYLSLPYRIEILPDPDEGGYVVRYPELPGCLSAGETIKEALENAEDAKRVWLEAAIQDGTDIAEPGTSDDYSGQFKLRIPKSLHRALAEHAKAEGTSMNQYCLYLLSKNDSLRTSK